MRCCHHLGGRFATLLYIYPMSPQCFLSCPHCCASREHQTPAGSLQRGPPGTPAAGSPSPAGGGARGRGGGGPGALRTVAWFSRHTQHSISLVVIFCFLSQMQSKHTVTDDTGRAARDRASGELSLEKAFGEYIRSIVDILRLYYRGGGGAG